MEGEEDHDYMQDLSRHRTTLLYTQPFHVGVVELPFLFLLQDASNVHEGHGTLDLIQGLCHNGLDP